MTQTARNLLNSNPTGDPHDHAAPRSSVFNSFRNPDQHSLRAGAHNEGHPGIRSGAGKSTFKVPEGFEVNLFASDPVIAKPIQTNPRYEALRQLLLRKNELYFHRWRPQNITYLFGFRKHEQGNNAADIAKFDPFILNLEKQIHELQKPQWRTVTVKKGR